MSMTPTRFCSSKRAFSLLEALVSMALFALVLGLMVQIFTMINRHERSLQGHAQALDAAFSGLERCRRECRMAVRWVTPATSDAALRNTIEFELPDYQQDPIRLPNPPLLDPVPAWDPLGALVRVRYEVIDQTLWRGVLVAGNYQRLPVCPKVVGLSIQRQPPQGLEIKLTLVETGPLNTLTQQFQLPCAHSWSTP